MHVALNEASQAAMNEVRKVAYKTCYIATCGCKNMERNKEKCSQN